MLPVAGYLLGWAWHAEPAFFMNIDPVDWALFGLYLFSPGLGLAIAFTLTSRKWFRIGLAVMAGWICALGVAAFLDALVWHSGVLVENDPQVSHLWGLFLPIHQWMLLILGLALTALAEAARVVHRALAGIGRR